MDKIDITPSKDLLEELGASMYKHAALANVADKAVRSIEYLNDIKLFGEGNESTWKKD